MIIRNGFFLPLQKKQVSSWVYLVLNVLVFFNLTEKYTLVLNEYTILTIIFGALNVLLLIFTMLATYSDPSDNNLKNVKVAATPPTAASSGILFAECNATQGAIDALKINRSACTCCSGA